MGQKRDTKPRKFVINKICLVTTLRSEKMCTIATFDQNGLISESPFVHLF